MSTTSIASRVAIRNILLATDFSSCSDTALPYAAGLARQYGSNLFIVNVIPGVFDTLPADPKQPYQEASDKLAEIARMDLLRGIKHQEFVGQGDVIPVIREFAGQNHIDLIVLGTHGRKGLGRLLLGSVAEAVFRNATCCPVLTIGPHVDQDARVEPRHILYATEFGEASEHGLTYALSLAEEHEAQLTLLHVTTLADTPPDEIEQQLRDLVPGDTNLKTRPEFLVGVGDPSTVIVEIARRIRADIIVLGVKRPMPLGSHLAAGTAYKVVCAAACPVLTVGLKKEA